LVLLDRDWGGDRSRPPQTKIFSHQCGGYLQPVGVKPPPPTNRTLVVVLVSRHLHFVDSSNWLLSTSIRNSSGDETANVNILYDDIIHAPQNTTDSCINSATDRCGFVLECRFTKFSEITQCNVYCTVQGNLKSPILLPIESLYTTSY